MSVPIDGGRRGGVVAARRAAIRELVDELHLDPLDALLDVDGRLVDAAGVQLAPALSALAAAAISMHRMLVEGFTVPAQRADP